MHINYAKKKTGAMNISRKKFVLEKLGRGNGQYPHVTRVMSGYLNASPKLAKEIAVAMGDKNLWTVFVDGTPRERRLAWAKYVREWRRKEAIKKARVTLKQMERARKQSRRGK